MPDATDFPLDKFIEHIPIYNVTILLHYLTFVIFTIQAVILFVRNVIFVEES